MVIVVDPADWSLNLDIGRLAWLDIQRVQELRGSVCDGDATFSLTLGSPFAFAFGI